MPSRLALWMSIIDFSQNAPIVECSVCEMEERKSKIDTCGGLVVEKGGCRQLLVAVAKL